MAAWLALTLLACGAILQALALAAAWWSRVEAPMLDEGVVALAAGAGLLLHLAGGALFLAAVRRAHLSLVLAALAPLVLLALIALGARGLVERPLASVLALVGTLALVGAAAWRRRIEVRAAPPAPGELAVLGVFVVTVVISLTVTLLPWTAWVWARDLGAMPAQPPRESTGSAMKLLALAREYRVPVDPSISLVDGSLAYHAVATRGHAYGPALPWFRQPPPRSRQPWLPEPNPIKEPFAALARRAGAGLTATEMAYLERLAADAGFRDVALVARAPSLDLLGAALLRVPVPDDVLPAQLVIINRFLSAVRPLTLRAALELARRQAGAAETTLREVISLGLAVHDNALAAYETQLALGVIRGQNDSGLENLAVLYEVTGREEDARRLRTAIPPAPPSPPGDVTKAMGDLTRAVRDVLDPQPGLRSAPSLSVTRAGLTQMVGGADWPRGYRTGVLDRLMLTQCANVGEMVFGAEPGLIETARAYAASVPRWPGEHELYRVAWEGPYRIARFDRHKGEPSLLLGAITTWLMTLTGSERQVGCVSGAAHTLARTRKF